MKKSIALLFVIGIVGCSTQPKETDYADLLQIKAEIERGSGDAVKRYGEIVGADKLAEIELNPDFINLKNQAIADLNTLIVETLEEGADKDAVVACIKENGADSEACREYVEQVRATTSPRLKQYNTELGKFIANHLDKKSHLPKGEGSCGVVHTGKFWQLIKGDTIRINRDEALEVEELNSNIRRERVTWLNDCTYRLELLAEGTEQANLREFPDDCVIEIIRVTTDHYIYKIFESVEGQPGELVDIGKVYFAAP